MTDCTLREPRGIWRRNVCYIRVGDADKGQIN